MVPKPIEQFSAVGDVYPDMIPGSWWLVEVDAGSANDTRIVN